MSDYYTDLERIKAAGRAYANAAIAAGETAPNDAPFSGEWAGGLLLQDALDMADIARRFDDLDDFEQTDVLDAWEDGYFSAAWPSESATPPDTESCSGEFMGARCPWPNASNCPIHSHLA